VLIFQDDQSICLWPQQLVASLTPAYPDRVRVVTHDGTVGYRPGGLPEGPWQPLNGSLVHANWLRPVQHQLEDPAGFTYPAASLLPQPPWEPPPYWGYESRPSGPVWRGQNDPPATSPPPDDWLQVSARLHIHPQRVRRLLVEARGRLKLLLDNGQKVSLTRQREPHLLRQLGLSDGRNLQPYMPALFRIFLREYPYELARAPAHVLSSQFSNPRHLIAQILWQAVSYRRHGIEAGYADTHRGFWYNPVRATLVRSGLWDENCERLYAEILGKMIGTDRLFTYQDLGFQDVYAQFREIGSRYPDVILFIEKDSLAEIGKQVARTLGLSWLISGGISHLGSSEFFCAALRPLYQGPVRVLVYGDFDPGGRVAGLAFANHLERYQVACPASPQFLVVPQLFSAEELELFARPLSAKNERVDEWLAQTGGINGQPLGIHADWLRPAERVLNAVKALLERG
jgi:hypothetical protein